MNTLVKKIMATGIFLLSANLVHAQTGNLIEDYLPQIVLTIAGIVALLILILLFVVLDMLRTFVALKQPEKAAAPKASWWAKFMKSMTATVPIEREAEVMTDHTYDGIKELDNRLPPWWLAMFYITIIFSVAYLLHYHVFKTGETQDEEYLTELAEAEEAIQMYKASLAESVDETNVEFTDDEAALAEGKKIFEASCAACHAMDGGGGVGPNMTDDYYIHGGDVKDIFNVIKYGVPQKGMIAWEAQLTPEQIQNVSSYLVAMRGTTPASPKEPQGDLYVAANED